MMLDQGEELARHRPLGPLHLAYAHPLQTVLHVQTTFLAPGTGFMEEFFHEPGWDGR